MSMRYTFTGMKHAQPPEKLENISAPSQKQFAILFSINLTTLDPETICNNFCSMIAPFDIANFQVYQKNWDVFVLR